MGRVTSVVFFCMLHCLLAAIACNAVLGGSLGEVKSQGDALDELFLRRLQRKTGRDSSSLSLSVSPNILINKILKALPQQHGLKEKDRISRLPGQLEDVDFDQYGGHVTIDEANGKALFYYFAEADRNNCSSKPLLLWLNGGPGCSSLGYGAFVELGPFRVMSDGKTLFRNPYAWNRVANVLFLESPVGTGFSYSNDTSEYDTYGDQKTAEENYIFLLNWLERFPEYKGRDFYIAGESYAGHYVPQLASIIHQQNLRLPIKPINLKGIMIGNPVINFETDMLGMFDFHWDHALISEESIEAIHRYCNFSIQEPSEQCAAAQSEVLQATGNIDRSNVYASMCSSDITPTPKTASIENFDPCTGDYVHEYLNNVEVKKALHAYVPWLDRSSWTACRLHWWQDSAITVLPLLKEFIANNIRVWVYSGDVDGKVPFTGTRYSLKQLGLPVKTKWQAWNDSDQIGGFSITYDGNLMFATVRGAGHAVPSYQPQRALELIKHFIEGNSLPTFEIAPPAFPLP